MKVMSYNTRFGGFEEGSNQRYLKIIEVIQSVKPDLLLMQEAKDFHLNGMGRLFLMEKEVDMRGFLAISPHTGQHTAIFMRREIHPLLQDSDSVHFHHAIAILRVRAKGLATPVTFVSAHLCPFGGQPRLTEACYLSNFADAEQMVLVAGDFNSVAPGDKEPSWETLPAHFKSRYVDPDSGKADRQALKVLLQAGFVDVAAIFGRNNESTVPTSSFTQVEFVPFRSDYILVSRPLAGLVKSYEVIKTDTTDFASDHYPIVAEFHEMS